MTEYKSNEKGLPSKPFTEEELNDFNFKSWSCGYWQSCPHCSGTGYEPHGNFNTAFPPCTVCNGKKIISTVNGLPPS